MDQEQPTAAGSIESRRQGGCAGLLWEAATLILNLPDHPVGREDAANTELLGGVLGLPWRTALTRASCNPSSIR